MNSPRVYWSFDHTTGYPVGPNLYYECLRCGEVLPSLPDDSCQCNCWNIGIEIGFSRIAVDDPTQVRLFEQKKLLGVMRERPEILLIDP